jgi:hypothetical protein
MSTTTIKRGLFDMDWTSDTTRDRQPCTGGCGKTTTGMSKGKPCCLPCALGAARRK